MQSRPSLELGQHQQLRLTPQLQQAIQLLGCSSLELEQAVAQALYDNPMLERLDEPGTRADEAERLERWWDKPLRSAASDHIPETAQPPSLGSFLLQQLQGTRATDRDRALVASLIGNLDERGYLDGDLAELLPTLPPEWKVGVGEWRAALRLLQSFDPPGVAARDLGECLRLQLDRLEAPGLPPGVLKAARELTSHLDQLAAGRVGRLCERLGCSPAVLDDAHALIRRLEPHPGRELAGDTAQYVVPDVLMHCVDGQWRASLNPDLSPRLRVNPAYLASLDEGGGELLAQARLARGLIRGVAHRAQTIERVAQELMRRQRGFLEEGPPGLRPLTLREVAEALALHESTVSRATRQKYAQTPWGVFELRLFFASGVSAGDGGTASAAAVQDALRQIVAQESPARPLSDSQLARHLAERGFPIARRTVAKYREDIGLPAASLRRIRSP